MACQKKIRIISEVRRNKIPIISKWGSRDNLFFIFLMKRLIHAIKTLKNTNTLKTQGYLYILCLFMLFLRFNHKHEK